jgi:medium-chain acyl-CoA synthetase
MTDLLSLGYGQTESTILCGNFNDNIVKLGSMGLPARGIPLTIVNEHGEECNAGTEGNIAVAVRNADGAHLIGITDGYLQADGTTRLDILRERKVEVGFQPRLWYLTGDRGYKDEDGYFWFIGRADDVINSSGYRIGTLLFSPPNFVASLYRHACVQISSCFG